MLATTEVDKVPSKHNVLPMWLLYVYCASNGLIISQGKSACPIKSSTSVQKITYYENRHICFKSWNP